MTMTNKNMMRQVARTMGLMLTAGALLSACEGAPGTPGGANDDNAPTATPVSASPSAPPTAGGASTASTQTQVEKAVQLRESIIHPSGNFGLTSGPFGPAELEVSVRKAHQFEAPGDPGDAAEENEEKVEHFQSPSDLNQSVPAAPQNAGDGMGALSGATRTISKDGVESVSSALAGTTTPSATFTFTTPTSYQNGGHPADAQLAAGISHICVTGRDRVGCFTKGGTPVQIDPSSAGDVQGDTFFAGLLTATDSLFDLRSFYDLFRNRFVIYGLTTTSARVVIAVSKTQNPRNGWNKYWIGAGDARACKPACLGSGTNTSTPVGSDYPIGGVDGTALYFRNTAVNFADCNHNGTQDSGETCTYDAVNLRDAQQMADGVGGGSVRGWIFWDLTLASGNKGWLIAPAVEETFNSRGFMVANDGASQIGVFGVSNVFASNQSVSLVTANVQAFGSTGGLTGKQKPNPAGSTPGDAVAPPMKFDNLGNALLNLHYRDNKLIMTANDSWAVNGVTRAAARLIRMDVSNYGSGSVTVDIDRRFGIASAGDAAGSTFDYGWPAATQNSAGDIAISTVRTDVSIFPQLRLSAWGLGDADIRSSILWKQGAAALYPFPSGPAPGLCCGGQAWVDTAGVSVDAFDYTGVYFAEEFPNAVGYNNFQIQVGKEFGTLNPDIAVNTVSLSATTVNRGVPFTLSTTAVNQGDKSMPASTGQVYLSNDNIVSINDTKLGSTFSVAALNAGATSGTSNVSLTVPTTQAPGTYFISPCLDVGGAASEISEYNNCTDGSSAIPPVQLTIPATIQINCGDNGAQAPFIADVFSSGGSVKTRTNTITTSGVANAAPAAVYQSQRYGTTFSYTIPGFAASSSHTVRLHFAETNTANNAAGKRKFSVAINGTTQLSNLDIFATVGLNKALVKSFTLNANSSGQYVISFTTAADAATISGIEIL
ncbi:MAG TPA: malectin domain-containing carbohydrate-binding protein [Polyangia bacterium]|nr:malectin domain-containing carbohydrate-binding protein [Polyangia bacterium]